jgi:hypothetical protein
VIQSPRWPPVSEFSEGSSRTTELRCPTSCSRLGRAFEPNG